MEKEIKRLLKCFKATELSEQDVTDAILKLIEKEKNELPSLLYAVSDSGGQGMMDKGLMGIYHSREAAKKAIGTNWLNIKEVRANELYENGVKS